MLFISFVFKPDFPLGRVAGATFIGQLEASHGQQQFQIVLLVPHQNGTKQGRKCNYSTQALDDIWVAFPWVQPAGLASSVFRWVFWIHGRTNVVVFSQLGEVVRHSEHCEVHSHALCREVSHQEHNRGHDALGAESLGSAKIRNNVASFLFNARHLIPKQLRFKYGGAKLVSCPGRNLTSARPFVTPWTLLKSYLWCLHLSLYSFGHYPRFMTIGKDRKKDRFEN